jgi:hypothetical protein
VDGMLAAAAGDLQEDTRRRQHPTQDLQNGRSVAKRGGCVTAFRRGHAWDYDTRTVANP